ncbi:hypothetical protein JHK85_025862 [Glycine max]|nr:hypothetical protein JHK85_025862 [Glycine max]
MNSSSREYNIVIFSSNSATRVTPPSFLVWMAMRISRARRFNFLRRVFHYKNGSSSNIGSNPFNSSTWMMLEFIALVVQITITTLTLAIFERERPIWPMRIWISSYDIAKYEDKEEVRQLPCVPYVLPKMCGSMAKNYI